jgi:hypothetical protein
MIMEYWTVLWITMLGGAFDGQGSFIVYPSLASCEAALMTVGDTLPYDHNLLCEEMTTPSASMRPQPNPFY